MKILMKKLNDEGTVSIEFHNETIDDCARNMLNVLFDKEIDSDVLDELMIDEFHNAKFYTDSDLANLKLFAKELVEKNESLIYIAIDDEVVAEK